MKLSILDLVIMVIFTNYMGFNMNKTFILIIIFMTFLCSLFGKAGNVYEDNACGLSLTIPNNILTKSDIKDKFDYENNRKYYLSIESYLFVE